jgi:ribose transport system permease protein
MEILTGFFKKSSTGILLVLIALVALFQSLNPAFLSSLNIAAILRSMSYTGIIAIGMGLCLMSGVIDLSAGATAAFASVLFSKALVMWELPLTVAIVLALLSGALFGLFNAFVIIKLRVTPFVATISSMFMIRGLALAWTKGFIVYPLPDRLGEIGMLKPFGVSVGFVLMIVIALLAWYVLEHTVFGLEIRATGSDYEVAKVTEVRYVMVHVVLLMTVGVLSAVSGILLSFVLNGGTPNVGTGWEFTAITACAIGGVSLMGYEGSIPGILYGLLVVYVLQNGIVVVGVSVFMQQVVVGVVLLIAIVLDVRRRKYLNLERL